MHRPNLVLEKNEMPKPTDGESLVGLQFNRWTVVAHAGFKYYSGNRKHVVIARCECGNEREVLFESISRKKNPSKSCGCLKSEVTSDRNRSGATHGLSGHPLYGTWLKMVRRCTNPEDDAYKDYGARGITVCDRWLNSVEAFIADIGDKPSARHSLERKENDEGYSPSNCVWATKVEQANNRRNSSKYLYDGKMMSLKELSEISGHPIRLLRNRLTKLGWSVDRAVGQGVARRILPGIPKGHLVDLADFIDNISDVLNAYGIYRQVVDKATDMLDANCLK